MTFFLAIFFIEKTKTKIIQEKLIQKPYWESNPRSDVVRGLSDWLAWHLTDI